MIKLNPKQALNKAFLKAKPHRAEIEDFKTNFRLLLAKIETLEAREQAEYEVHLNNDIRDFLRDTYYKDTNAINTQEHTDLAIHLGKETSTKVGVIIEVKRPSNAREMITCDNLNAKAFQELVFYYLKQRITHQNIEVKHLIVTNVHEWFIFDAAIFERLFAQNKEFVKQYDDFTKERLADNRTSFFYEQIAKPFISRIENEIEFTYFHLKDYQILLQNESSSEDNLLIALFKLLSPTHLLKLSFANDGNSLDKDFYNELLHIMGLVETDEENKKLIKRKKEGERNSGSILENTINQLVSLDKITQLENPTEFGDNQQEQLFNLALELSITWINRVLFLKLLEGQLIRYHKNEKSYYFLNNNLIKGYGDLNHLFFQVLARKQAERNEEDKKVFEKIPYLNSTLFEPTELEQLSLFVSNLNDNSVMPIFSKTVLKDAQGKKQEGKLNTLQYLFAFLGAYDFGSEGEEEIQEDRKTLINAAVLGLIFEKINGYKDGSFFTPAYITMYMCRESIRGVVLQKFNEVKKWNCQNFDDLYNKIENLDEANEIVNSIKICDPAVGSGHFLVSALNEMIAIKGDLRILQDRNGRRLRGHKVEILNDELIITDEEGDLFKYNYKNAESQRIQETIFHEKAMLIEKCLFGVDINPNSVKICRLRLWIELLKNAYYKNERNNELETLPNIDINIKCGNSLISKFQLNDGLNRFSPANRQYLKRILPEYKKQIDLYKAVRDKAAKNVIIEKINEYLTKLNSFYNPDDKDFINLKQKEEEAIKSYAAAFLDWEVIEKLEAERDILKAKYAEKMKHFQNAFEWRFGFPEVLNEEGDFAGFDIIMGNPPYIALQQMFIKKKEALQAQNFQTFESTGDIYVLFYEKAFQLLKPQGYLCYVTSRQWMQAKYGKSLRKYLSEQINTLQLIDFGQTKVFEAATVFVNILIAQKAENEHKTQTYLIENKDKVSAQVRNMKNLFTIRRDLDENSWTLSNSTSYLRQIEAKGNSLFELENEKQLLISGGIKTGFNKAFHINEETKNDLIQADTKNSKIIKPLLRGKDIKRYNYQFGNLYIINSHNGVRKSNIPKIDVPIDYPLIFQHLRKYETDLIERLDKGEHWTNLRDCAFLGEFDKPKIVWIEISDKGNYAYDEKGMYLTNSAYFLTVSEISKYSLKYLLAILNAKISDYYFSYFTAIIAGGRMRYTKQYVEKIIIPDIEKEAQRPFEILADYILFLKKQDFTDSKDKMMSYYFEHIIDLAAFELFFPQEMNEAGFKILNTLQNLPTDLSLETIKCQHKHFQDIKHPVRNAISTIQNYKPFSDIYRHLNNKS